MCQQEIQIESLSAEQYDKCGKTYQDGCRDLKCDTAHCPQDHASDEQCDRRVSNNATGISNKHLYCIHSLTCCHLSQRCCRTVSINCIICNNTAEGDQQKTTSGQCRVHKVVSQASKQVLCNDNRKCCTKTRNIDRHTCRKTQCQKKSCHNGTAIFQGILSMRYVIKYKFCQHG